ncbi:FAD-dependent oxidoreductase [Actinoplanes sp. NPDC049548]|uniref:FAD-dependent oxidoreductase n=1 Tax=Actinoplanes sp. NPDC049548 TaxID=3155152 RepID=UPI00342774CB
MATESISPEVLVVGAGPAGLTAAYNLARHGVRVRLVDRAAGPATTSRALATHARTLEIYDQMDVLAELMPRGRRVEHFTLHQGGRRLVRFDTDYSRLPTRFPFTLMVDQVITEEVLRDAAARLGVTVEWGVTLAAFEQDDGGVTATLRHADGRVEECAAGWLVGCDGGHSTVRKTLELPLLGDSTETWLIADAYVDTDLPQDSIHWLHTGSGTVMLVPFPEAGKWRLLDTADARGDADPDAVAARFERKLGRALGRRTPVARPSWVSVFTIQQRMVPRMRVGRCLVAGDAAHVHSPASGQGLNTGIQDAYNLAWKLAMVVQGTAGADLLDSYEAERVPIGRRLIGSTKRATALVALKNTMMAAALPVGTAVLRTVGPLKRRIERSIMGAMSGLALSYADSPLSRPSRVRRRGPVPGARVSVVTAGSYDAPGWRAFAAELRRPEWILLTGTDVADGVLPEPDSHGGALRVLRVATQGTAPAVLPDPDGKLRADLGLAPEGWLLVRPDGYLAAAGPDLAGADLGALLDELLVRHGHRPPAMTAVHRPHQESAT